MKEDKNLFLNISRFGNVSAQNSERLKNISKESTITVTPA